VGIRARANSDGGPSTIAPVNGVDEPVVEIVHARRTFGRIVALDDFSMFAPRGSVTVLLGPNGAGKTTAVRIITGALNLETGSVRVFGRDLMTDGEEVRRRCGVVAAKPALYERLSGRDNLRYAADLYSLGDQAPIDEAAARFGIDHALHLRVGGYSTGMKTRLALARAILHDPDLLLLDEPTSGLDPESSHAVLNLIHELATSGKTVVMCTHLLLEAEGLADQIVIMEAGRDAMNGTPEQLVRRFWPFPEIVLRAERPSDLDRIKTWEGVLGYERNGGPARVSLDSLDRVPDLVAGLVTEGVRLTHVTPHEPTLEELYFEVRRRAGAEE
jgi:ABC-2 type transport system ATP-binding protein